MKILLFVVMLFAKKILCFFHCMVNNIDLFKKNIKIKNTTIFDTFVFVGLNLCPHVIPNCKTLLNPLKLQYFLVLCGVIAKSCFCQIKRHMEQNNEQLPFIITSYFHFQI